MKQTPMERRTGGRPEKAESYELVDGRQAKGIVEDDSKRGRGSQWATQLLMMTINMN